MSTPEWDIFKRIEELEDISLEQMGKTETIEPTLRETSDKARDAYILAELAFVLGFGAYLGHHSSNPIETRDKFLKVLKSQGLSEKLYEPISKFIASSTKRFEKGQR